MTPHFFLFVDKIVENCENSGSVVARPVLDKPIGFCRHRYRNPKLIQNYGVYPVAAATKNKGSLKKAPYYFCSWWTKL